MPLPETKEPESKRKGFLSEFCVISLLMGILGLLLPPFSSLAIIVGIAGIMHTRRVETKGRWMAVVGMILGVIGILIFIFALLAGLTIMENYINQFSAITDMAGAYTKKQR